MMIKTIDCEPDIELIVEWRYYFRRHSFEQQAEKQQAKAKKPTTLPYIWSRSKSKPWSKSRSKMKGGEIYGLPKTTSLSKWPPMMSGHHSSQIPSDPLEFNKLSLVWGKPQQHLLGVEEDMEMKMLGSRQILTHRDDKHM